MKTYSLGQVGGGVVNRDPGESFSQPARVPGQFWKPGAPPREEMVDEEYEDELDLQRSGSYFNCSTVSAWSERSLDPGDIRVGAALPPSPPPFGASFQGPGRGRCCPAPSFPRLASLLLYHCPELLP